MNQDDCRRAARRVVSMLVAAGSRDAESLGDAEELQEHIDLRTGFLSIEVINVQWAGLLGLHVEEASTSWECCQAEQWPCSVGEFEQSALDSIARRA